MENRPIPALAFVFAASRIRPALVFLFLLLFGTRLFALTPPPMGSAVQWNLTFYLDGQPLPADSVIEVQYLAADGRWVPTTILATRQNGTAVLYAKKSNAIARFVHDDLSTPAEDEAWGGNLDEAWSNGQTQIILQPLSYLGGRVDTPDGQPAAGASLELVCGNGFSKKWNATESGTFKLDELKPSRCTLSAFLNGRVGRKEVELQKGQLEYVALALGDDWTVPLSYAGAGILALALIWMSIEKYVRQAGKKEAEPGSRPSARGPSKPNAKEKRIVSSSARAGAASHSSPSGPTLRQKDLMQTLQPKEKEIMHYLLRASPSAVKASKLRRDLLIPKTSFWRLMLSLERKQLVVLKKDGARSFVSLAEFFRQA